MTGAPGSTRLSATRTPSPGAFPVGGADARDDEVAPTSTAARRDSRITRIFSSSVRAGGVRGWSSSPTRVVPSDDAESTIRPPEPNTLRKNPADEALAPASIRSKRTFGR